jgi:hypothetical protein
MKKNILALLFFVLLFCISLSSFANTPQEVIKLVSKRNGFYKIWDLKKNLIVSYSLFVASLKKQQDRKKMVEFLAYLSSNTNYRKRFKSDLSGLLYSAKISVTKINLNGNYALIKADISTKTGIVSPALFLMHKKHHYWKLYLFLLGNDNLLSLQQRYKKMTEGILKLNKNKISLLIKYMVNTYTN